MLSIRVDLGVGCSAPMLLDLMFYNGTLMSSGVYPLVSIFSIYLSVHYLSLYESRDQPPVYLSTRLLNRLSVCSSVSFYHLSVHLLFCRFCVFMFIHRTLVLSVSLSSYL